MALARGFPEDCRGRCLQYKPAGGGGLWTRERCEKNEALRHSRGTDVKR
jgi:hypothetical protein